MRATSSGHKGHLRVVAALDALDHCGVRTAEDERKEEEWGRTRHLGTEMF